MTDDNANVIDARELFTLPRGALYLNTAADGPRLVTVLQAARDTVSRSVAPWRLGMDAWRAQIEHVRALASHLFDGDSNGVALVPSAGYGLSVAARNVPLWPGQCVLVLEGQFPSNLLPWQRHCAEVGARLVAVQREREADWTDAVLASLHANADARVLALPQVHWHDGSMLDLDRISAEAQRRGVALVLDLSQSLGVLHADIAQWQPDFVVAVGHKWLLGGSGLTYLWAAPQWRSQGEPLEQSWIARNLGEDWSVPVARAPEYRQGARRYDAGGVADPGRLAMAEAALSQILEWGVGSIAVQLQLRTEALHAALDVRGISGLLGRGHAPHMCSVRLPPEQLGQVAQALAEANVIVTVRHGVVRISPHMHVGPGELSLVAQTISDAL